MHDDGGIRPSCPGSHPFTFGHQPIGGVNIAEYGFASCRDHGHDHFMANRCRECHTANAPTIAPALEENGQTERCAADGEDSLRHELMREDARQLADLNGQEHSRIHEQLRVGRA